MNTWYIVAGIMLFLVLFIMVRNFPDLWRYFKIKSM
jgi:hypothetical protein